MNDWKKIEIKKDSVDVRGYYYTSIRSLHYNEKEKIVRISYQSDRCQDQEFLNYLHEEIPELKNYKLKNVYDDNHEWLCDWNVGDPTGGVLLC